MKVSYKQLKECIRRSLVEGPNPSEIILSDGSSVPFGSSEHISDMQATLSGIDRLKKHHRYGTAARSKFADAGSYLKRFINRIQPEQPKTFAQLESDSPETGGKK